MKEMEIIQVYEKSDYTLKAVELVPYPVLQNSKSILFVQLNKSTYLTVFRKSHNTQNSLL